MTHQTPVSDSRIDDLVALNEFSHTINVSLAFDKILEAGLSAVREILGASVSFMFLREDERLVVKKIIPEPRASDFGAWERHFLHECLCGLAARENQPVYSHDIHTDERCTRSECKNAGFASLAIVPLRSHGEVFGIMGLAADTPRNFQEKNILIENLASLFSLSLRNARNYEKARLEIEARKAAEEALRISAETYRILVEHPTDLVVKVDREGRFLYVNPSYCKTFGQSESELLGKPFMPLVHEDDRETTASAMKDLEHEPHTCYLEQRALTAKGWRWMAWSETAIVGLDGSIDAVIGVGRDVTEQKRDREELQDKRYFLNSVLESIQDGISVLNPDLSIRYTNDVMKKWYSANLPLQGKFCFHCYHDADKPCDPCPTLRCIQTGNTEMDVVPGLPGSPVEWVELYSYPIRHPETGDVTGVVEFVRDITERKRAETAVALERERLAVTLRSIGDAVITTDMQGSIVLMNPVAEQLTGWSLEESVGLPLTDIFVILNESTHAPRRSPVDKVLDSGDIVELTNHTLLIARDGAERVIAHSGAPITNAEGDTIGIVLVFRDTTEKRKFLEASQRNQKLESLGILAGGIAHDFNNLLAGIFGYVDIASLESKTEKVKKYLENAMGVLERARSLTMQLLTFAKGGSPVKKRTSLFPFVRDVVQFALSGSNVQAIFEVEENLWMCDVDANQVSQVIENIVINAQQATPLGGTITIRARNTTITNENATLPKGPYAQISIEDEGIGISHDILPRIFDPFFTTKSKGHGLGLATSHSIIARHGGDILAESTGGKGTKIVVYLPAEPVGAAEKEPSMPKKHRGEGAVLIMDDEDIVLEVLESMLHLLGYHVFKTRGGREAIDFYTTQKAEGNDLVAAILDLTIPGDLSGKDVVTEIRKHDEDIPVFVSSGYASDDAIANPNNYGFTDRIVKPFRMDDLALLLGKYL